MSTGVARLTRLAGHPLAGVTPSDFDEMSAALHAAAALPGMVPARALLGRLRMPCEPRLATSPVWEPGVVLYDWSDDGRELNANLYEGLAFNLLVESGLEPLAETAVDLASRLAIPASAVRAVIRDDREARALFPASLIYGRFQREARKTSSVFRVA